MKIDYAAHYDNLYWTGKKTYRSPSGQVMRYQGPSLTWDGFELIADALANLLPRGSLLDVGCSGGDLMSRLLRRGFSPFGVDVSKHAIDNCIPQMTNRIMLADVTTSPSLKFKDPAPEVFDTVIGTDFMEHIYQEDLDTTFDWLLSKTKSCMFYCVATANDKEQFVLKKGATIPLMYEGCAIAGHVNVRSFEWWVKFFIGKNLQVDWMRMYMFQMWREQHQDWRNTPGWNMSTTFFLRKA